MSHKLTGLTAAVHSPFDSYGELKLSAVESQAAHLVRNRVEFAFVGGSTGESHSLSFDERIRLTEQWCLVAQSFGIKVIVHVGSNCLRDARSLAAHAQTAGAIAISALAPMYFKPHSLEVLIDCCAEIASGAPELPFYFYDIPVLTGVNFSMPAFLEQAPAKVPNLAGLKFTNPDLMAYQKCLRTGMDIPWGIDEHMLAALSMGAQGAVGSSFNFAAPVYHRLMNAFSEGNLETARQEQLRSVDLITLLASYGYMAAAKATLGFLGVNVGGPRLPNAGLTPEKSKQLQKDLEALGFFEWGVA